MPFGIFIRDGPTGRFLCSAELVLQGCRVDLYHKTIDFVTEVISKRFLFVREIAHFVDRLAFLTILVDAKTGPFEPVECFPVRSEWFATIYEQIVGKHVELATRHQPGIELPDGTGSSIAGVLEERLALLFTFGVCSFKNGARNKHFAAHFKIGIDTLLLRLKTQRHAANRASILCDVFTDASIATRHATHQQTRVILQRQRKAIDFELGDVLKFATFSETAAAFVKGAQLVDVVAIVEREHLASMNDFGKTFCGSTANSLCGTVRCD